MQAFRTAATFPANLPTVGLAALALADAGAEGAEDFARAMASPTSSSSLSGFGSSCPSSARLFLPPGWLSPAPASASASAAKPTVGRFAGNVAAVRKACVDNGHSGKRKLEVRDVAAAQQPPLKRSKAEKGSVAEQALAKQAKVAALKRQALVSSTPTVPTAYVDAQGGRMKPRSTAVRKNAPMPPKPLPDTPGSVLVRLSQGNRELPLGAHARFIAMTEVDKDKPPDIVLVSDLLKLWESHYALIARLFGARASWTCAGCSPTGAGATALPSIQRSVWATSFT